MVHIATGTFHHGVRRAIFLSIGVIIGTQPGASFSKKLSGMWIIRGLAIALALIGIRLIIKFGYNY